MVLRRVRRLLGLRPPYYEDRQRLYSAIKSGEISKTISYGYNLDGSLASVTYPSGRKISYDVGTAGRSLTAKDTANGVNYALSATYAPQGALGSVINGQVSGGFAGINWTASYNNRLAPTSVVASSAAGAARRVGFWAFW